MTTYVNREAQRHLQRSQPAALPAPLVIDFPLRDTHSGMVLGNGLFGVMVWGEADRLCVTVNRADFWDHRAGVEVTGRNLYQWLIDHFDPEDPAAHDPPFEAMFRAQLGADCLTRPLAFRNTRLPMGRFEFTLCRGLELRQAILDMAHGRLTITCGRADDSRASEIHFCMDPQQPLLEISDPQRVLASTTALPAWRWTGDAMASRGYEPPCMIDTAPDDQTLRLTGWAQAVPHDPKHHDSAMAAMCLHRDSSMVVCMTAGETSQAAIENAEALARSVHGSPGDATTAQRASRWWQDYWRGLPLVEIPDAFFQDFLNLAMYKFGAATNPASPLPCALQGPWCEEYQIPRWSGDYHFNVNIQMIYALAFPAGKAAHLLPLFDMLDRALPVFRRQARSMVGVEDGVLMTHTTDDLGYACGGVGPGAAIDQAVSGWTALLYWQYYQHTGDKTFLRDRAMPFMQGVLNVFDAMLQWDDGCASLPIGISAEYAHTLPDGARQRVGPGPSYQYACIHMLCQSLTQAADALGESPDPRWAQLQQAVPNYTLIGPPDQQRIAVWKDQDLAISHRHHSHLACLYPFDTLARRDEAQQAVITRTLEHWLAVGMSDWSEWCYPIAAILQAREGWRESPYLLLKICRELFINKGMATVYIPNFEGFTLHGLRHKTGPLETCQIMQLDGTMGIALAVYEMLVHAHRGVIRFFPAVPNQWRDARFAGIHLPGGVEASGGMKQGEVVDVTLQAVTDLEVTLDVPGYRTLQVEASNGAQSLSLPAKINLQARTPFHARPVR